MSGHSKWATIKRKKGATDGQRVSESYWGISGEPVRNNQGIHEKRWDYAGGEAPPFEEGE